MRFREPYVSEGLNQKMAIVSPPGVYRGFRLATNATANWVSIQSSSDGDSVAAYQTDTRYSVTLTRVGNFNVDLTSLVDVVDVTVVIALYTTYVVGATTAATVRAYTIDPVDELTGAPEEGELVVLGTVVIPANSVAAIPAANITESRRTMAWQNKAGEAEEWHSVLKNGNFEYGAADTTGQPKAIPFWEASNTQTYWTRLAFGVDTGAFAVSPYVTAGPSFDETLTQRIGVEAFDGQRVLVEFGRERFGSASTGTGGVQLVFKTEDGTDLTPIDVDINIQGAVDGAVIPVSEMIEAPATAAVLDRASIFMSSATFVGKGNYFTIDDLQISVERFSREAKSHVGEAIDSHQVVVRSDDPTALYTDEASVLTYDHTTPATRGTMTLGGINTASPPILTVEDLVVTGGTASSYLHPTKTMVLPAALCLREFETDYDVSNVTGAIFFNNGQQQAILPLPLHIGDTIESVTFWATGGGTTLDMEFVIGYGIVTSGSGVTIQSEVNNTTGSFTQVVVPTFAQTVITARPMFLRVTSSVGSTADRFSHAEISYKTSA